MKNFHCFKVKLKMLILNKEINFFFFLWPLWICIDSPTTYQDESFCQKLTFKGARPCFNMVPPQ